MIVIITLLLLVVAMAQQMIKGVSYTEMEYRYALETDKPIVAFLHRIQRK